MSDLERATENKLVRGWASAPRVRVRQAAAADLDALERICGLADVPFETPLREAITEQMAGAGLRAGLRGGIKDYRTFMAGKFLAMRQQNLSPLGAYMYAALVLVAEHRDHGVVGGLIAYPPVNVAEDFLTTLESAGASGPEMEKVMLGMGMMLTRVKAVAMDEHARGANIGGSLLKRTRQVYTQLQYRYIYGAMPPTPGLDAFYQRAGFTVLNHDEPLDLWVLFGNDAKVFPAGDERLFVRHTPSQ